MRFSKVVGEGPKPLPEIGNKQYQKWLDDHCPPQIKSDVMVGVEIEVENVRMTEKNLDPYLPGSKSLDWGTLLGVMWSIKEDGSLRNNGHEFVTKAGMTGTQASQALLFLDKYFSLYYPKIQANARTGVHVHLNFLDKTGPQFAAFTLLYLLFEKTLFKLSGGRTANIFCVDVRHSLNVISEMLRKIRKNPDNVSQIIKLAHRSPKYLAYNVGALRNFGTVELRHMSGTNVPSEILPWLDTLLRMHDYACKQQFEPLLTRIKALNSNSMYEEMIREVLPKNMIRKLGEPMIIQDMIDGCMFIKEAFIVPEEVGLTNPPSGVEDDPPPGFDDFGGRGRVVLGGGNVPLYPDANPWKVLTIEGFGRQVQAIRLVDDLNTAWWELENRDPLTEALLNQRPLFIEGTWQRMRLDQEYVPQFARPGTRLRADAIADRLAREGVPRPGGGDRGGEVGGVRALETVLRMGRDGRREGGGAVGTNNQLEPARRGAPIVPGSDWWPNTTGETAAAFMTRHDNERITGVRHDARVVTRAHLTALRRD